MYGRSTTDGNVRAAIRCRDEPFGPFDNWYHDRPLGHGWHSRSISLTITSSHQVCADIPLAQACGPIVAPSQADARRGLMFQTFPVLIPPVKPHDFRLPTDLDPIPHYELEIPLDRHRIEVELRARVSYEVLVHMRKSL